MFEISHFIFQILCILFLKELVPNRTLKRKQKHRRTWISFFFFFVQAKIEGNIVYCDVQIFFFFFFLRSRDA